MKLSPASIKRRQLKAQREVRKLRELAHFLLVGRVCCFCEQPLSPTAEAFTDHGNAWGPELVDRISIHHLDGNHANNAHENKALSHESCHRSYHMTQRWAKKSELETTR